MIGLTGGIASGKSTVARVLRELGAVVLDADVLAREVVEPHKPAWREIARFFPEVILPNDEIDRQRLGAIVFRDPQKLRILEEIIHPQVLQEIREQGLAQEAQGKIVVADIPLLFETKSDAWLSPIWVVYVDEETQLRRLMLRDNLNEEEARRRIVQQWPLEKKRELADEVIDNNGSLEETKEQVIRLWKEYISENRVNCS